MSRKGITPVVAITLLIGVVVAGAGTMFAFYTDLQQSVTRGSDTQIPVTRKTLSVESCWGTRADPNLSVRNMGTAAINASEIPVLLNGTRLSQTQNDYNIYNTIADPQGTFTVDLNPPAPINEDTAITFLTQSKPLRYHCIDIS
ncbi:MAG: hypothetical protein ABEJ36_02605 [Candidatus Nanosalina sp.]